MSFEDLLEVARAEDRVGDFVYDCIVARLELTHKTGVKDGH